MAKIIDAVSIVLTHRDEIFSIQRQYFLNAFPGYWAFPGGKVEKDDEHYFLDHSVTNGIDPKIFGAVIREGKEELGVDLRDEIKSGNILSIHCLGLAITPDFNPYRFATYFFKIDLKNKIPFVVDENEARLADWTKANNLLADYHSGQILAVPPVVRVIEALGINPKIQKIDNINFDYDSSSQVPYIESIYGIRQLMPFSNTLPPAMRTNAFHIGDDGASKIIIDPSPKNEEEYIKLKNTILPLGLDKILITHHHPDHYERSNQLARDLRVPILLSRYTFERITRKTPQYFDDVSLKILDEGESITKWLGREVLVMHIPGHDEGQIGIYPEDLSWYIAGDLFQGIGTVVIGGEEGDMKKYLSSLERIIKLSPKVIFPSHGIGVGGTYVLEKIIEHRLMRESQVLNLYLEGLSPEEMLSKLYSEVNKNLWPYALENIHQHLKKLRDENKI